MGAGVPDIVLITPVYNEEDGLERYVQAVSRELLSCRGYGFSVIFVDDGSSDGSWEKIRGICAADSRFSGIRLSRNFGAHTAISAGMDMAGDCSALCTLPCDLQEPPETILRFLKEWEKGSMIVWGKREERADAGWRKLTSDAFYRLLRKFALPRTSCFTTGSFLLMDRAVVDCFRQMRETNRVTFALAAWIGFRQTQVSYARGARVTGSSGWTLGRMLKTCYDVFIGFSGIPIRLITILGLALFLGSWLCSLYLVASYFLGGAAPGWTSLMSGITMFFGLSFLMMGMLGEYLSRIYVEVLRRPLYFVSESTAGRME